MTGFTMG